MSMEHKAFALDWTGFVASLYPLRNRALETGETGGLAEYVEANRGLHIDPYEWQPLDDDWQEGLENGDVHELGDYALTRFYNPAASAGLGVVWTELSETVSEDAQLAFLGSSLGTAGCQFDPGRMGSYFQSPTDVRVSLRVIEELQQPQVEPFRELLQRCVAEELGLYVTF